MEVVTKTDSIFSLGDIIAIIVSFLAVITAALITSTTTKKINRSNEILQERLTQKEIDATLIAKARIEWIQKVRNNTAELLALYFEVINTVDKDSLLESTIKAQEKTELLILFFGHEEQDQVTENQPVDLFCLENNNNKNTSIVEFLSTLSKKVYQFYESAKSGELNRLQDIRSRRINEMLKHVVDQEEVEYKDRNGNTRTYPEPILDKRYEDSLKEVDNEINNVVKVSKDIERDLLKLRNIIRIYLKIEWNKAKSGE